MKTTAEPAGREPSVFTFDFRTLNRETPLEREARLADTFRSRLLRLQARGSPGILSHSLRPNALLNLQQPQQQQLLQQSLLTQQAEFGAWAPSLLPLPEIGPLEDAFLPYSILHELPSRTVGRRQAHCLAPRFCGPLSARIFRFPQPSSALLRMATTPGISVDGTIDEEDDDPSAVDAGVVKQLAFLAPSERLHAVRSLTLALATRRRYRLQAITETAMWRGRPDTKLEALQARTGTLVQSLVQSAQDCVSLVTRPLAPWHTSLREVSGRFGTGVSSYFTLIRTLLAFNLLATVLFTAFLVTPQLLVRAHGDAGGQEDEEGAGTSARGNGTRGNVSRENVARGNGTGPVAFTGLELLTGTGAFTHSSFYYGFYSNETLSWWTSGGEGASAANATGPRGSPAPRTEDPSYNMQLAYLFTMVAYLLTCVFVLLCWLGRSFSENYLRGGEIGFYSRKVFTGWDFALTSSRAVHVTRRNIGTFLKEVLAEGARRNRGSPRARWSRRLLARAPTWLLSMALAAGSAAGLHFLCQSADALERRGEALWLEVSLLLVPAVACLVNTLLPPVFTTLTHLEGYHSPRHGVYASVGRNLLLKVSLLAVLCYDWLQRSPVPHSECWETRLGQDLYRLVVMDFIFSLLGTFFIEFVWRLLLSSSSSSSSCRGKSSSEPEQQGSHKPEFDIARNVLDLIYGQTLAWLGIFFAPLLPLVQLIKLIILFYVKRRSLYLNCQPPTKPWRASQMSTIFLLLLFFPSFFSVVAVVAVTMWTREPSPGCGPFRGLPLAYDAVRRWAASLPFGSAAIAWIYHNLVESPIFFFAATSLVLLIIYINVQILAAQRHVIELLQARIEHEGQDKIFVLEKLREEHKRQMEVKAARQSKRSRQKDKKNYSAQMWPCQADLS
ncbi:transmembrane channel-like protein 6 isoform X1 [Petromyzon marinus]|uniref:transmembrane channel-like protein 6 isoform X1 n=1 Tax=Petromyzon marinus TaxID=7757 RepID=UPI003F6F7B98